MIRFLKDADDRDKLINSIIAEEWDMYVQIQNIAEDQAGDGHGFYVKRYAWLCPFAEDTLQSYLSDLRVSKNAGINMVALKYAYTMQMTDYAYFDDHLRKNVPPVDDHKMALASAAALKFSQYEKEFEAKYPKFAARSLNTAEGVQESSFDAYTLGELETYTADTLKLIKRDAEADPQILVKMREEEAKLSGFTGLDAAEAGL